MDAATPRVPAPALPAALAGLQSGMIGALCLVLWLGVVAEWQQRNFWIPVNLMASAFYGPRAIRSGFAGETLSGLAVYIAIYPLLGAALAIVLRDRVSRARTFLIAVAFALVWYYLSFRLLWKSMIPLAALLHVERTTALGHLLYGAVLGGYPSRLPRAEQPLPDGRGSVPDHQPPPDPSRDREGAVSNGADSVS
jgi:hypothetical protein